MKNSVIKSVVLVFVSAIIISLPFLYRDNAVIVSGAKVKDASDLIILDAGHGGEDGGAIGIDGTLEKDINLDITLKTGEFFRLLGYDVVYTRETDKMTCDSGLSGQRAKKVSDIKNRLELIEHSNCKFFLSIHQNFFGGSAHGAQTFYGKNNPMSKDLAEAIQNGIAKMLQKENNREIKKSTDDIYILYKATKPSVLVECGFVSDSNDLKNLKDNLYQNKIAYSIALSAAKFSSEVENNGET